MRRVPLEPLMNRFDLLLIEAQPEVSAERLAPRAGYLVGLEVIKPIRYAVNITSLRSRFEVRISRLRLWLFNRPGTRRGFLSGPVEHRLPIGINPAIKKPVKHLRPRVRRAQILPMLVQIDSEPASAFIPSSLNA